MINPNVQNQGGFAPTDVLDPLMRELHAELERHRRAVLDIARRIADDGIDATLDDIDELLARPGHTIDSAAFWTLVGNPPPREPVSAA
jgi:hypothetical protein